MGCRRKMCPMSDAERAGENASAMVGKAAPNGTSRTARNRPRAKTGSLLCTGAACHPSARGMPMRVGMARWMGDFITWVIGAPAVLSPAVEVDLVDDGND